MQPVRYAIHVMATAVLCTTMASLGAAEPTPPPTCKDLAESALKNLVTPQSKVRDLPDGCLFTNARMKTGTLQSWSVRELAITGLGPWDRDVSPIPLRAKLEARGVQLAPQIENSHVRYQIGLTQKPFDARFEFDVDLPSRQMHVREISLESPWLGHIGLAVDAQLTPPGRADPFAFEAIRISQIRFVLDNRVVFENMVMPSIIGLIPDDKDPAIEFPRLQKDSERRLRKLPDSVLDPDSRDALIRFDRDFRKR